MLINGKKYEYKTIGLIELFNKFNINPNHIVVELNGEIVERKNFNNQIVNYQDKLEIVTFVGGG